MNGLEVCPSLPPEATGDSVCVATINEGDEEITVEVRDPENASNTDSITLSITSTEAPTAEIIRPEENGVFYSDHLITFEGMIGDAEDEVEEIWSIRGQVLWMNPLISIPQFKAMVRCWEVHTCLLDSTLSHSMLKTQQEKHRQTVLQLPLVDQTMLQLVTLPSQILALQVQKGI